jgi:hypothetical protein
VEAMIGSANNSSNPVILNLFQDPSRIPTRRFQLEANRADCFAPAHSGQAAEWILKQVQDDEKSSTDLNS